jgi:hypothetical protein
MQRPLGWMLWMTPNCLKTLREGLQRLFRATRENGPMRVEQLEQIAALLVTAGLVAGNLLLFSPWRRDKEPGERLRHRSEVPAMLRSEPVRAGASGTGMGTGIPNARPGEPALVETGRGRHSPGAS